MSAAVVYLAAVLTTGPVFLGQPMEIRSWPDPGILRPGRGEGGEREEQQKKEKERARERERAER